MNARIVSFRRGRHTQHTNQFLVEIEGVDSTEKAKKLFGKKVVWSSPAGKKIFGTITNTHGGNGMVRARFNKGLPGTAVTQKVKILE